MRCRECASLNATALYKIHPGKLFLTFIVTTALCTLGAYVLGFLSYFIIFASYYYGNGVGEVILRLTGRKRGPAVEAIGVASIIIGALIVYGFQFFSEMVEMQADAAQNHTVVSTTDLLTGLMTGNIFHLIGIVIACVMCYRYVK